MGIKSRQIGLHKDKTTTTVVPEFDFGQGIPKVIYQTYRSFSALPNEIQRNIKKIQLLNPGWAYQFFDDNDAAVFIEHHYGAAMLAIYQRIDPSYGAARADLFRYLLIYRFGGVYLDIKSTVTGRLDDYIHKEDAYILSHWEQPVAYKELAQFPQGEYMQWFIIASAGHPFLRQVIIRVINNMAAYNPLLHGVGKQAVLRITGPFAYTLAIDSIIDQWPYRVVEYPDKLGLKYSCFTNQWGKQSHETQLANHYSLNTTPVIRLQGIKKYLADGYLHFRQKQKLKKRAKSNEAIEHCKLNRR